MSTATEPNATVQTLDPSIRQAFANDSNLLHCLEPLLQHLGWQGNKHHIIETLPHFAAKLDLSGFSRIMQELGFDHQSFKVSLAQFDTRLCPGLFIPNYGSPWLIIDGDADTITIFDSSSSRLKKISRPNLPGTMHRFETKPKSAMSLN